MKPLPSIFNDVIGPVMRGPSSSHTAASWRVANMAVQLLNESLVEAVIVFDKEGQWATNYREQGTVLGMNGGLLGIDMADDNMKFTQKIAHKKKVSIEYTVGTFENNHPNSMLLNLKGKSGRTLEVLAASLGGGSFEIQRIDHFKVSLRGDFYHLIIWGLQDLSNDISGLVNPPFNVTAHQNEEKFLNVIHSSIPFGENIIELLEKDHRIYRYSSVLPVMPIISGMEQALPFSDINSLIKFSKERKMSLGKIGILYEACRSGLSQQDLYDKMDVLIHIIQKSINTGLAGTDHSDRILPQQSHLIDIAENSGKILQKSIINTIIKYVAAIMESKSALEVVVANPTAGSCGTVGAVLAAVAEEMQASKQKMLDAYFACGLIGIYFANGPGFSAEEHGCQVECGASAGMAAAGIVELWGGSAEQALAAASMAIQNMIGLVCDPIADRVEAPCLGKNTSAAVNALASSTMAISGFAHLIPLDQVLDTVKQVSSHMPSCVKCTGCGGLAITPAAQKIKAMLAE